MCINQAGQDGITLRINHGCVSRNAYLPVRADGRDALALDEHGHALLWFSTSPINQCTMCQCQGHLCVFPFYYGLMNQLQTVLMSACDASYVWGFVRSIACNGSEYNRYVGPALRQLFCPARRVYLFYSRETANTRTIKPNTPIMSQETQRVVSLVQGVVPSRTGTIR